MKPLPSFSPLASVLVRAERTRAALAGVPHTSLPLPVAGAEGTLWRVWFVPSETDPDTSALRIGVPSYSMSFRADFGVFTELTALRPRDLGLADDAGPWLGEVTDAAERRAKVPRLVELLQEAAPSFAAGPRGLTAEAKRAAAEIKALFPQAAEPPLLDFYARASARFFAWLDFAASP